MQSQKEGQVEKNEIADSKNNSNQAFAANDQKSQKVDQNDSEQGKVKSLSTKNALA